MSYKLKKELGFLSLFCIASGAMISSGLFILPGLVFARAGPSPRPNWLQPCLKQEGIIFLLTEVWVPT